MSHPTPTYRSPVLGKRVAALHGWDIEHGGPHCDPAGLLAEGFTLLALDAPAMVHCLRDALAFSTVEDWFSHTGRDIDDLELSAEAAANGWWEHDRGALTTGAILWPERDHWKEPHVWVIALTATRLAGALREAGVSELRVAQGHPFEMLAPDRFPSRLTAAILLELLPDVVHPLHVPPPPLPQRLRERISDSPVGGVLRSLRGAHEERLFRVSADQLRKSTEQERLTLLMLPRRELDRSGPIVARLADHLPGAIVAVPWEDSLPVTSLAGGLNDVPWLPTPSLSRGQRRTEARLREGVDRNLAAHDLRELEPVRVQLRQELRQFANRWAAYSARLTQTIRLLRILDPALVVVGRDDVRYQIPGEAATHLGIPTLSLPHGVVEWSPPERLFPLPGSVHLGGIENPTAPPGAILRCAETFVVYEYPRRVETIGVRQGPGAMMTILALTDGVAGEHWPSPGLWAHEEALRGIASAAGEAGSDVRVLLKPHPGTAEHDRSIVEALELRNITVLPRTADLAEVLAASDVVIGVNNVSSALVHALNLALPVLRFMVGPHADVEKGRRSARPWLRFWSDAVPTFSDARSLASTLMRIHDDAEFRLQLGERSMELAETLAPPTATPTVAEVVDRILSTESRHHRARQRDPQGDRHRATLRRPTRR